MSDYNEEIYADRMSDKFSETDYSNSSEDEISMDSDLEAEPFEMLQIPSFSDSDPEEERIKYQPRLMSQNQVLP
ncbi:hypothetical protein KM043_012963 [Ampulex compressa]|nr:hypothetical protein KM043_012963 [Ampulex compressa]